MRNDEVRRTTGQPRLSAIVQAQCLSLFGHIARMPDETDAKRLWRTGGDHWDALVIHGWWLSSQQDLKSSNNLSLNEAIDVGSESSTLETDVCVWRYAPLVVHATQEEDWQKCHINYVTHFVFLYLACILSHCLSRSSWHSIYLSFKCRTSARVDLPTGRSFASTVLTALEPLLCPNLSSIYMTLISSSICTTMDLMESWITW